MSDTPNWTFYPHRSAPGALDVVWCHFPLVEFPEAPGPKPRPALVRKVDQYDAGIYLEVSFGTSNAGTYSNRDLYIANYVSMRDAGLFQATIFHLDRTATLPWAKEWFTPQKGSRTPIIGSLNQQSRGYLEHLVSRR